MKINTLIFLVLLLWSSAVIADDTLDEETEMLAVAAIQESIAENLSTIDVVTPENKKIEECALKYVESQRSHSPNQVYLFQLFFDLDGLRNVMNGVKHKPAEIATTEKVIANARRHCKLLYDNGWIDQEWHPLNKRGKRNR